MAISEILNSNLANALGNEAARVEIKAILDAAEVLSSTETAFIDGVTAGTAAASKAMVLDANKDIAGVRGITDTFMEAGSVTVAADELPIPVTDAVVLKTTGINAEALTLANGVSGQILTIILDTDGGGDGTLTPTTCTGFATIVFADAGDQATLKFIDSTIGWIIMGLAGVAAPPAITV